MLAFLKDLLIIASAAWFLSGVEQLVFSGSLSLAYTFIVALVLPYAERSANNADVLTALMLAMRTLLTADFQDEDDTESHSTGIFAIFAGGAVIALAQILHTVLVGTEPVRARLPRFGVPTSRKERTRMTRSR